MDKYAIDLEIEYIFYKDIKAQANHPSELATDLRSCSFPFCLVFMAYYFSCADEERGCTLPNMCFAVCIPDRPMVSKWMSHVSYK